MRELSVPKISAPREDPDDLEPVQPATKDARQQKPLDVPKRQAPSSPKTDPSTQSPKQSTNREWGSGMGGIQARLKKSDFSSTTVSKIGSIVK